MKKITSALFFATIITLSMIGCSQETELRWKNEGNAQVQDIMWVPGDATTTNPNQTWSGTYNNDGSTTDFKTVDRLSGEGYCTANTDGSLKEHLISYDDGSGLQSEKTLAEGNSETITIDTLTVSTK